MQPILRITVPVKKIKGAAHQCYGGSDGVVLYEPTFAQGVCGDIVNQTGHPLIFREMAMAVPRVVLV